MKKSIFLFFAAILCATSAWGSTKFVAGDVLFYDFTDVPNNGGVNWAYSAGNLVYDPIGAGTVKCLVFTNTQTWSSSTLIAKTQYGSWSEIKFTTDRPAGCNCIKFNENGKGYTWTTRSIEEAVLSGNYIMVYGGELTSWKQDKFLFMATNSTDDTKAVASIKQTIKINSEDYYFGPALVAPGTYYMGHWNSGLKYSVEAGSAYVVRGSGASTTYFTKRTEGGGNYLYQVKKQSSTPTTTLTPTYSATIMEGEKLPFTPGDAGVSVVGKTNTIKYYLKNGSTYTEKTLTDNTIDVSDLPAGNYSIETLLYDEYIYVKASTSNFTIESAYDVTFANDGNGTTNQTGTIKVGAITGIAIDATPNTDYVFNTWQSSNGGTFGSPVATASNKFYPTENTTVTATFRSTAVNALLVVAGANIESVTGSKEPVTLGEAYNITATPLAGYAFEKWVAEPAENGVFADAASASTTVTVQNASVTVTASATEIMSALTTSNSYDTGTPSIAAPTATVSEIGITTTANITAAVGEGYTFTGWTLTNCVRTDDGADNATTITVKSNGDGVAATVTANYEQNVVYFVNTKGWETVNVYAWDPANTAWPGQNLTDADVVKTIGGCKVYKYVSDKNRANVIFNNGSEQTDDLTWQNGKYYVYNSENTKDKTDWYTEAEVEGVLPTPVQLTYTVEVPAGTNECYIAGEMNGWSFTKMDPVDATHFTATIQWATNAHKYKYACGPDWNWEEVKEDGSKVDSREYKPSDKVAKWAFIYDPSAETYDYYIAGTMNGWNKLDPNYGLAEVSTNNYTRELTLAAGTYEFKVKKNGEDKWYGFSDITGDYTEVSNNEGNIKLTLAAEKTFTVKFDSNTKKISFEGLTVVTYSDITVKAYTEAGAPQIWWWGSKGAKSLSADQTKDALGNNYHYSDNPPTMTAIVGEANWYEWTIKDVATHSGVTVRLKNTTTASADYTITENTCFDARDIANAKKTTCGVTPSDCPDCSGIYLKGDFNSWQPNNEFMKTSDNNVVKLSITLAVGNYEFKIHGDNKWYGNAGSMTRENTNQSWSFSNAVENKAKIRVDVAGEYVFTWNTTSGNKLTVTYPAFPNLGSQPEKIYFYPNSNWKEKNATFKAYFFDGDIGNTAKWGDLTDADGDGIYEVTNDKKYIHISFVRINPEGTDPDPWQNKWNQTEDLTIPTTSYLGCWIDNLNWWDGATGTWAMPLSSGDNSAAIAAAAGNKVTALVNRSFTTDDSYYTLCVPFDMSASLVGTAYQISSLIKKTTDYVEVNLASSSTITAGAPYLIVPNKTTDYLLVENVTIKNTTGTSIEKSISGLSVSMQGVINGSNGTTDGLYWVGNNGYLYNDSANKLGLRTYFDIQTSSPMPPRFRVVTGENAATGVDNIISTETSVKVIENGQIIIIRNGEKYNIQGMKL